MTTAISTQASKPKTISQILEEYKPQFEKALPKHITAERFGRVALTIINRTPKLGQCTPASLFACLLDCAALGLEPDGRKAHLIPYGDKCTLIIDYKGLVDLARRSGQISDIHADIVCKNDKFEYSFGSKGGLFHQPNLEDRGDMIAAYSYVKLRDGSESFEVMNMKEIDAVMKRSKASSSGPWQSDKPEMAKKTVFRRHSKWLPVSIEFQEAMEKDYDAPEFDRIPVPAPVAMPTPASEAPQANEEREPGTEG